VQVADEGHPGSAQQIVSGRTESLHVGTVVAPTTVLWPHVQPALKSTQEALAPGDEEPPQANAMTAKTATNVEAYGRTYDAPAAASGSRYTSSTSMEHPTDASSTWLPLSYS
jgi:hypothetical protein